MKTIVFSILFLLTCFPIMAQWEPDVRLTNDPASSITSYNTEWCIASSGDTVYVTWYDNRDGNLEIYCKRSTDGGLTWEADTRLTNDPATSTAPSVAVSGSVVHIVWLDTRDGNGEIYYKRSTDGGVSWGTDIRLTNNTLWSTTPSVSASGSWVHVVWSDQDPGVKNEVYHKSSADGGLSWGPATLLTGASTMAYNPSVASSGSDVFVVWNDSRDGNLEIYFNHSSDGGLSWDAETRLTNDLAISGSPSIALSGSIIHVVWYDNRNGNKEIYYKHSSNGGQTWWPDNRLTDDDGESLAPNITSEGSAVNVVWRDDRDGNYEIYFKRSSDGGLSWEPDTRLTDNVSESQKPSASISGSVTHVVWYDDRFLNQEIFYKRNPAGGAITGIDEGSSSVNGNEILIYPNPASDKVNINLHMDDSGVTLISVYNVLGEMLIKREIRESWTIIDISCLPKGIYFIGVTLEKKPVIRKKLIVSGQK